MIYTGRQVVADTAVPEALTPTSIMASWVTIIPLRNNTGIVYVGGVDETNKTCAVLPGATTHLGHPLIKPAAAGNASDPCTFPPIADINYIDLNKIFVAVDTNGDGVTFNYGRR